MDELFVNFARGLFILLLLFGFTMAAVLLFGDPLLGSKMVNAFTSMFAGLLGLGSGYLLGRKSKENGKS